jgi:hypothetical protein
VVFPLLDVAEIQRQDHSRELLLHRHCPTYARGAGFALVVDERPTALAAPRIGRSRKQPPLRHRAVVRTARPSRTYFHEHGRMLALSRGLGLDDAALWRSALVVSVPSDEFGPAVSAPRTQTVHAGGHALLRVAGIAFVSATAASARTL